MKKHKVCFGSAEFECGICGKRFPLYYRNKRKQERGGPFSDYWGDRGRYNFRGAKANFLRHIQACEKKQLTESK